ncbi:HAD-IA family hydrolase [Candidatus Pacearchaeota archaeon]|nr:HAD-IA family hydrolase [Candidatus Pacearchaeota archaeon]
MEIKSIFFDIGGVLVKEDRKKQYAQLAKIMHFNLKEFQKLRKSRVKLFAEGKTSEKQYLQLFSNAFEIDIKKLKYNWISLAKKYYKINKPVEKTIQKLKNSYILGTLTNIIPLHHKVRKTDNPYKYFKINILSFEQGYSKPDIKFYKLILKKTGLKPKEIIFIDDYSPYLKPAKKLSMKTILFKNNKNLVRDLRKLEVKI